MSEPLHIVFVSGDDPLDVRSFSGVLYYMVRALRSIYPEMEIVRDPRPRWYRWFQQAVLKSSGGRANPYYWRWLNRRFARRLARRWEGRRVLVIAIVNAGLVSELAGLVPVLNVSDSTFELMRNFYANFARYETRTAVAAEDIERDSIQRSVHNSFSSQWAADSAVRHYGAKAEDVSAISWGCNLDPVPASEVRALGVASATLRLLFLGGDWARKGGDVVCETAELLSKLGPAVHADLVGAAPPSGLPDRLWLTHHGFLSKADAAQLEDYHRLVSQADFLFLPTRQDCTPMIFAECNAYGMPAVTRDVGGVASVVRDGVNGIVLPEDATAADFADAIEAAWRDRARYAALREGARREYEERLNWNSWAQAIAGVIARLEAERRI